MDLKCKHLLQCRRLQSCHVGKELKQDHLCCRDDLVSEPPSRRQNNLPINMGQRIGTIIYTQFWCFIFLLLMQTISQCYLRKWEHSNCSIQPLLGHLPHCAARPWWLVASFAVEWENNFPMERARSDQTKCSEHCLGSRADTVHQTLPQCNRESETCPSFYCGRRHNPDLHPGLHLL